MIKESGRRREVLMIILNDVRLILLGTRILNSFPSFLPFFMSFAGDDNLE